MKRDFLQLSDFSPDEHRALFRDLGFLPHDYDKIAYIATNSLEAYGSDSRCGTQPL